MTASNPHAVVIAGFQEIGLTLKKPFSLKGYDPRGHARLVIIIIIVIISSLSLHSSELGVGYHFEILHMHSRSVSAHPHPP